MRVKNILLLQDINNIFDIFSEIGGIAQFIFYLLYWINYVYNNFVIDFDTNSLFFNLNEKKPQIIRNNNIKVNSISNKININGNDNKIYNIQNNILKLPRKGTKKFRNTNFYVNKNEIQNKNNFSDYGINLNQEQSSDKQEAKHFEMDNMNQKTIMRRTKLLETKIINDDNSRQILNDIKLGKNFDLINNIENIDSNKKKRITIINNSPNQNLSYDNSFIKPNKYNNEKEKDNMFILNKNEENYTKSFWPNIHLLLSSISISKSSIYRINYDPHGIMRRNKKIIGTKTFSIFSYTKSLISRKNKKKYEYLTLFRMHLLSEEHLLKSHIKMVLFEKKYNLDDEEKTNVLECYNEL